jgi:uncharacterized delta-60 repeat protein
MKISLHLFGNIILVAFILFSNISFTQNIFIDNSFNIGTGFNSSLITTTIQNDGKIICGGSYSTYNNASVNRICRLNNNGTIDASFIIGNGFELSNGTCNVTATAIQNDNKILAVGTFDSYNGTAIYNIARLNPNGAIDLQFNTGSGFNGTPRVILIQSDGKIIIGGSFSSYNGFPASNIVRLNSDGTIDTYFDFGSGFNSEVRAITIQNDGKIIVAGAFTNYNGTSKNRIIRLNQNGTFDSSFNVGLGLDNTVYSMAIQNDGKIVCGGLFLNANGISANNIVRFNIDGSNDLSYINGSGLSNGSGIVNITSLCLTNSGGIIVGGSFSTFNSINRNNILLLNSDGTLNGEFNLGSTFNAYSSIYSLSLKFGKLIVGGNFSSYNGLSKNRILKFTVCDAPQSGTINITECDQYISSTNNIYYQSGIYYDTLQTIYGCDSLYLTINLNILNSNSSTFINSICNGDLFIWNGQNYNQSGLYTQTLQNLNGCDSIVTMHLIVNPTNFNPSFSTTQQLYTNPPFAVQFMNTTSNLGNYIFTWYWGDGTSTTSNNTSVFHEYLTNGLYTVALEAKNNNTGCSDESTYIDYIFTTGGVGCTHSANIVQTGPITACSGQNVVLSCNSSSNYSFQWRRNGVYISGNNNDTLLVTQPGAYSVIISYNGCPISSNEVSVNFTSISVPIINYTGSIQPCIGGSVTLTTASGYSSYLWSNGDTNQNTTVNSSGSYSVQVTNSSGCSITSAIYTINASILPTQNICVVGIDSITNDIRVVWEKQITSAIDSFYVYKESSIANVFTKVGTCAYDSLSIWVDTTSNPAVQAYRYKITAIDTCGQETPLSDFHKTIHLTINQGVSNTWNLMWSAYEGISFGSYNIYRGTSLNNMNLLNTIQSNLNSYTDLSAPVGNVFYQIEIVNPNNCNPTKSMNYNSSKSNIVNTNSSSLVEIKEPLFLIYPNPANDLFTIESDADLNNKFLIIDAVGRNVLSGLLSSSKSTFNISNFSRGTYIIKVEGFEKPIRFIKQY